MTLLHNSTSHHVLLHIDKEVYLVRAAGTLTLGTDAHKHKVWTVFSVKGPAKSAKHWVRSFHGHAPNHPLGTLVWDGHKLHASESHHGGLQLVKKKVHSAKGRTMRTGT